MTLDEVPAGKDPVHLLAIGDSKVGKSVYAAQAAIDGFNVVYIDADNGLSALRYMLEKHPEAKKRVHYFPTTRPVDFVKGFLRSTEKAPFRWNPKLNKVWGKLASNTEPDDSIWEFDVTKLPASWLLVIDSWTALASDALGIGAADQAAALLDGTNQAIYGEANSNLTYIVNILQKIPCHTLVQAHGTRYEVYDKPTGVLGGAMKQKDMILRETKDVPFSSSRPHGETMVSRFNHIGWLYIEGVGTVIDFTRKANRVGGGPPNRKANVNELTFTKLVGAVPPHEEAVGFYRIGTHAEFKG